MNKRSANRAVLAALLSMAFGAPSAWAEKPEWAGQGGKHKQKDGKGRDTGADGRNGGRDGSKAGRDGGAVRGQRREPRVGGYFDSHDREAAHRWYGERYGGGKGCPPGLAKKNNGCLPPGQARKYAVGQRLPAGVVVYPVPAAVVVQLPPPPHGHKYVRVATDILLIAIGTSMVVDAITDLGL